MNALLTDLYELNMVASYLRRGMEGAATFSLFVRRLPATRGFIVAAGIESSLDFLEQLHFEEDDLHYLREVLASDPPMWRRSGAFASPVMSGRFPKAGSRWRENRCSR